MHAHLNVAIKAALNAGKLIIRALERPDKLQISEKGLNDFVTQVDKSAESSILETIHELYPEHCTLSEETGALQNKDTEVRWIIDPIDGTTNFIHGFPQFCVSIAVEFRGKIEHAVIYDPLSQDLYTTSRGKGAQLNNRRIRVSQNYHFQHALLACAFPVRQKEQLTQYLKKFTSIFSACGDIRRSGSAALDLAYVAAGKLDGFWEENLKIWDIAAGSLLIQEAGGYVGDFLGEANYLQTGNIVAGNRKIYTQLQHLLD